MLISLQLAMAAFVAFAAIIALFLLLSSAYASRSAGRKPGAGSRKIFACGEDARPARMDVHQESFYRAFIKSMGLGRLRAWHSGYLGRYIAWVFAGLIVLMFYLLVTWRLA